MPAFPNEFSPIALALDEIEVTDNLRFCGIDLDTGVRVCVAVDNGSGNGSGNGSLVHRYSAHGLILTLTVGSVNALP